MTANNENPSAATAAVPGAPSAAAPAKAAESKPGPGREAKPLQPEIRPHAFVVMPFGKKKGADGHPYDFNEIYRLLIKPALIEAGFDPFRADEETASGDILTDMFQELLLADLVISDLSIDNANAFYELGIRHALRKRGAVHIQAGRAYMPFDIFNVRTLQYHITEEGVPDPAYIRADITAISRLVKDTWASDRDAVHSPIYNLLAGLEEPERKSLHTPLARGFWREYNDWREKVTIAQRQKHIGDILLLTEEIRNPLIREEAVNEVGRALANLGRNELALVQYRKGIEVNSSNLEFRREEAFHLNRIGRVDEAIVKIESLLEEFPNDGKSITYLGRIYKEMWTASWKNIRERGKRMRQAFKSYHWLIKSMDIYMKGFQMDLNDYYPGINAFTLSTIAVHLADRFDSKKNPNPEIARVRAMLPDLHSALQFGLGSRIDLDDEKTDYWTLISLAELKLLTASDIVEVERGYRKAITASRRNLFYLGSSLDQLKILQALGMRPRCVSAGIDLIEEEIARVSSGERNVLPSLRKLPKKPKGGRSFLFAGYMVDFPEKEKKTFPAEKENEIRNEIRRKLERYKPAPNDRAFLAGLSAGSEIIFAEVCVELGLEVKAYLPLAEAAYVREFVTPCGEAWVDRFYKISNHPLVDEIYQVESVGPPRPGDDPHERNNRWALYSALGRAGMGNVRLIVVWNETGGSLKDRDARLVRHMMELMRSMGGAVETINPAKYIHSVIDSALERLMLEPSAPGKPPLARPMKKPRVEKK
jgi:tetratricopeptide (TPR) repeat protein